MKKYTLEEISVKGLKLFKFEDDVNYWNQKLQIQTGENEWGEDVVVGLITFNNEICLETTNPSCGTAYIPISELIRIGILEEQPKEIQFDIWN